MADAPYYLDPFANIIGCHFGGDGPGGDFESGVALLIGTFVTLISTIPYAVSQAGNLSLATGGFRSNIYQTSGGVTTISTGSGDSATFNIVGAPGNQSLSPSPGYDAGNPATSPSWGEANATLLVFAQDGDGHIENLGSYSFSWGEATLLFLDASSSYSPTRTVSGPGSARWLLFPVSFVAP